MLIVGDRLTECIVRRGDDTWPAWNMEDRRVAGNVRSEEGIGRLKAVVDDDEEQPVLKTASTHGVEKPRHLRSYSPCSVHPSRYVPLTLHQRLARPSGPRSTPPPCRNRDAPGSRLDVQ